MRPVSLRVRGLHSYREPQTVDLSEVTRAGIFGVFGPTGAGKSTLLDAITLALYGQVDRADRGTRGILNQLEDSLDVAFAFELNGVDGRRRYRVERRYTRAKDIPAAVRSGACRLVETAAGGAERVLADSPRGVTDAVTALLGLTAEDFARAVVLPQGRFAQFLRLTGAERREMLQRLFGLERYGEDLAGRIRGELARVEPELGAVEAEQAGLGDASEDALTRARQALEAVGAVAAAADARLAGARAAWETWNQVWGWQNELEVLAGREAEHAGRAAAVRAATEELDASRRADAVRPYLEAWERARSDARKGEERVPQLAGERQAAEAARQGAEADRNRARERRHAEEPALQRRRGELEEALQLEAQLQPLRAERDAAGAAVTAAEGAAAQAEEAYREAGQRVETLQAQQRQDAEALQALTVDPERRDRVRLALEALGAYRRAVEAEGRCAGDLAQAQGHRDGAVQAADTAALALTEIETAHRAAAAARTEWENAPHEREEDLREAALAAGRHRAAVDAYLAALRRRGESWDEHRQADADLAAAAAARQEAEVARQTADEAVRQAEADRVQAATALREAEIRDRAAALAAALEPGRPCPVCGSLEHPHPVDGVPSTEVQQAQTRLTLAEEGLRTAQEALARGRAAGEAARVGQEAADKRVGTAVLHLQATDADLGQAAGTLPPPWRQPDDRPEAASLAARVEAEERSVADRRAALDGWAADLQARRTREETELQGLLKAQRGAAEVQAAASQAGGVVRAREASLRDAQAGVEEAAAALAGIRGELTDEAIEAENRAIAQADREGRRVSTRLSERAGEIAASEQDRQTAEARRAAAQADREAAQRHLDGVGREAGRLEDRLRQVTGDTPARDLLDEVVSRLAALDEAERSAQGALDGADERLQQATVAEKSARSQLEEARRRAADAWARLDAEVRQRGFPSHEAAHAALRAAAEQDALEGIVRRHEEEATGLRGERQRLEGLLHGRSVDEPTWRAYGEALRQAEAERQEAQQALGAARQEMEGIERRHARWSELELRRGQLSRERDDLTELQSVLRGAAFVEFLAEEQLRAVARNASGRLSRLTRGRYALEVEPREGFIVRDDHNGGIGRPVSSLSGGETFLTSLALALALSTQIQLRGRYPLEFFFLDEGFGSLDPEALDTAMDALERLHEEHLVIGVISHLQEVRARMPVRIVVERAEPGGAGSRLRVEVA